MKELCLLLILVFGAQYLHGSIAAKVKVMLLSGENNHNWKQTTPLIKELLESSQRFEIRVVNHIQNIAPKTLSEYDVIVSNWNLWKYRKGVPARLVWPDELKAAYVDYVRSGGGHVVIHAGSSTFYDWPDYQQICVATWHKGTHHGPSHQFEVRIEDKQHPVTKGLKNFRKWDELWEKVYVSDKIATVLTSSYASSEFKGDNIWEPSTWVSQFGQGRTAYTSFGHSSNAFESEDFKILLQRLVEWSATGQVTIPISR